MNFFVEKPIKNTKSTTSWSNLGNRDYQDEDDIDFVVSDQDPVDTDTTNNSECSSDLEKYDKQTFRAKRKLRKRVVRRGGCNVSESSEEETHEALSDDEVIKVPSFLSKNEQKPPRRRLRARRKSRKLIIAADSEDEKIAELKKNLNSDGDEEEPLKKQPKKFPVVENNLKKKEGTLDMTSTVLLKPVTIPLNSQEYVDAEAPEKRTDESSSEDGDTEPKERNKKLKHIASSDESEASLCAAKTRRRAKIEDSEDEFVIKKEPLLRTNEEGTRIRGELDESSENSNDSLSDFVDSEEENGSKKPVKEIANTDSKDSASSSSDESVKVKPSILTQLAPELLTTLRNNNDMTLKIFQTVARLYIKDNLNTKSLDTVFKDGGSEHNNDRNSLAVLNRNLDEAISKCQTGAWQKILKRRLDTHPCLVSRSRPKTFYCNLCGRHRHCTDEILLWGRPYNQNTLRSLKVFESELTDEEKDASLQPYPGQDGTSGIVATIGPTCLKRLLLYHELRHYKIQFYNDLSEEFQREISTPTMKTRYMLAERNEKNRIIGDDLEMITNEIYGKLAEGTVRVSFNHIRDLLRSAKELDCYLGYMMTETIAQFIP